MSDIPPPNLPGPPPGGTPPPPPPANLTPPPGYQSYNAAPTPMGRLHRVKGLSVATMILTGIAGVGAIITAVSTPAAVESAEDFLAGNITQSQFEDDYLTYGLTQSLQSIGTLATAVLTIIWLYRIAANVRTMGRATTWAPLWAVFAWILPPTLIIIPFLMVREMWKASDPSASHDPSSWKQSSDNPVIWVWFVLYGVIPTIVIALTGSSVISAALSQEAEDLAEGLVDTGTTMALVAAASVVGAAIAWIIVVRQLTERHAQLTNER